MASAAWASSCARGAHESSVLRMALNRVDFPTLGLPTKHDRCRRRRAGTRGPVARDRHLRALTSIATAVAASTAIRDPPTATTRAPNGARCCLLYTSDAADD